MTFLNSAVDVLRKFSTRGDKRSKLADALYNLGLAYENFPDYKKALEVIQNT